jgi:hypothetical protein
VESTEQNTAGLQTSQLPQFEVRKYPMLLKSISFFAVGFCLFFFIPIAVGGPPNDACDLPQDSFGKLNASTGSLVNPLQYTARESDTETGLYYYRARYYDS